MGSDDHSPASALTCAIDGDPNIDRIPCSIEPSDALVIAESVHHSPTVLYVVVTGDGRDVALNLAGVTALRDRCDAFIREHAPRHCSEDVGDERADRNGADSIAAAVAHFVAEEL